MPLTDSTTPPIFGILKPYLLLTVVVVDVVVVIVAVVVGVVVVNELGLVLVDVLVLGSVGLFVDVNTLRVVALFVMSGVLVVVAGLVDGVDGVDGGSLPPDSLPRLSPGLVG